MVRPGRRQPWQVVAVTVDALRLRDLTGDVVEVARRSVLPDPLDTQIGLFAQPLGSSDPRPAARAGLRRS